MNRPRPVVSPAKSRPNPSRRRGRASIRRTTVVLGASTALLAAALVSTPSTAAMTTQAKRPAPRPPSITVATSQPRGKVSPNLLGVNHRWKLNGHGLWSRTTRSPNRKIVRKARRAGISTLRYPGGTTATMFDWKRAVGRDRNCQIEGHGGRDQHYVPARRGTAYGPDEFVRVLRAIGAKGLIMVPFINETPTDAAAWVEYMNSPVRGNPNGGVDWANRRAKNGHRKPYGIRMWEVGNETHIAPARFHLRHGLRGARQYANGGQRQFYAEPLGKKCTHPRDGVASNGRRSQVFETLYAPVQASSFELTVGPRVWKRVSKRRLAGASPRARVYHLDYRSGEVRFGDGRNGRIPADGKPVRASYVNKYAGFFKFVRQMKSVDPSIRVCASWGRSEFAKAARSRRYDCVAAHPMTNFGSRKGKTWDSRIEGHDRMMTSVKERRLDVEALQASVPNRTSVVLTEFKALRGDGEAFRGWQTSASQVTYMASLWVEWLRLGIRWGNGGALLGVNEGPVLGSPPEYVFSGEAVLRQAMRPMFLARGRVLNTSIAHNPLRRNSYGEGAYHALSAMATRGRNGGLWLMVTNKHPRRAVKTSVRLKGFVTTGSARVRRVVSEKFRSRNSGAHPRAIRLATHRRRTSPRSFTHTFPAHSVTVFNLRRR